LHKKKTAVKKAPLNNQAVLFLCSAEIPMQFYVTGRSIVYIFFRFRRGMDRFVLLLEYCVLQ